LKDNGSISAAVLIPVFLKHGEEHLLFTKRTETVETHRGQISFPGGVRDKADRTLEETAIRETFEEIGIVREDIDTLGALDDFITGTGYCIYPLVGIITYPYDFKISEKEVAEILEVPVSTLLDRRNYIEDKNYIYKGKPYDYCAFKYGKHNIWGTTGRIVRNFLTLFYGWNFNDQR
ncbi:MAG: CoA pyrophosphatase, partial [Candidatus Eremiobacterota bacterium]